MGSLLIYPPFCQKGIFVIRYKLSYAEPLICFSIEDIFVTSYPRGDIVKEIPLLSVRNVCPGGKLAIIQSQCQSKIMKAKHFSLNEI